MIIVDTNLLVRVIVNDNVNQVGIAKTILEKEQIYIPKTVLLELVWTLESVYKLEKNEILSALNSLLKPKNITVEDMPQVRQSLQWYENGMEFADALHLSAAFGSVNEFATFDQSLIKKSSKHPHHDWRPQICNPSELRTL